MKKLLMVTGLLCSVLGLLSAQNFIPAQYEEISLSTFRDWRQGSSGEEKKFKIPALFNFAGDISLRFIDAALEEQVEFETEYPWPRLQSGQPVTLYITAWGPWVWDRQLDAIDYGNNRLVQADPPVTDYAGPSPEDQAPSQTGIPAANPTSAEIASSRETAPIPAAPASAAPDSADVDYGRAPRIVPRQVVVQISGNPPREGRYYRLQVGSFSVRGNATRAANSLKEAGLNPAFEEYQNNVRVVLPRVPGEDVVETARKIGSAGFTEVRCREE
jgi:hypothetical protein